MIVLGGAGSEGRGRWRSGGGRGGSARVLVGVEVGWRGVELDLDLLGLVEKVCCGENGREGVGGCGGKWGVALWEMLEGGSGLEEVEDRRRVLELVRKEGNARRSHSETFGRFYLWHEYRVWMVRSRRGARSALRLVKIWIRGLFWFPFNISSSSNIPFSAGFSIVVSEACFPFEACFAF